MSDSLEINVQILDEQAVIKLHGPIDEDSEFEKVSSILVDQYVFDFENVSMINSCGVREWINLVEKLPTQSKVVYKHCPQVVIEQINMVQGFIRKGAHIDSFYAPYYSESKDEVQKVLLKSSQIKDGKAPVIKDQQTGEELEFDAIEDQYFNFLKQLD